MQKQKGISPPQRDPVHGVTTLVGIIIIILVAVILFGGVFAYQYYTTKSETASWKTYTNNFYGYSVKYPSNWTSDVSSDLSHQNVELWFSSKKFGIQIYVSQILTGTTLQNYLASRNCQNNNIETTCKIFSSQNVTVGGTAAIQREEVSYPEGVFKELITYLQQNDFLITIKTLKDASGFRTGDSIELTAAEKATYSQIISTFKFTK